MTARSVFREEILQNAQAAVFIGQTSALTGPAWSQWFIAGSKANKNVLAFKVRWAAALTATAAESATSGTSVLDENLDQLQVSADPTQDPRTYIVDSYCAQELERLAMDLANLSYPKATPAAFSGSGTRTDTVTLWAPAGGPIAAIRWHVPSMTGVYAANVTGTSQGTVFAVYGNASTIVVAKETTGSAVTGKIDVVNQNLVPADIAPDYVDFVGVYEAGNSSGITQMQAYGPDGDLLVDFDSAQDTLDAQAIYPDQYGLQNPEYATNKYPTVIGLQGKRPKKMTATFGASYTPTVLWVEFAAGEAVAPTPTHSPTPVPPAIQDTQATSASARVAAGLGVGPRRMQ